MPTVSQVSRSLELPHGYQMFSYYSHGMNPGGVCLNDVDSLIKEWSRSKDKMYLYTQHEIFYQDGILKQTRSSPNWEGGIVTFSTCKHRMRTYDIATWEDMWIGGLCPSQLSNCLLFVGRVSCQFNSNYHMGSWMEEEFPYARNIKSACNNPRGDVYTPLMDMSVHEEEQYDHHNFIEPENHTRSVEFYKRSHGSVSEREDGQIPKWWRDIEYVGAKGRRPPSFVLSPCFIFSEPLVWTSYNPRRAALKINIGEFVRSLSKSKKKP